MLLKFSATSSAVYVLLSFEQVISHTLVCFTTMVVMVVSSFDLNVISFYTSGMGTVPAKAKVAGPVMYTL
jgi:hypothetical protein